MGHTARGKTRKPIRKPTRDRVLRSCPRRRSPDADGGTRRADHGPGAGETATATGASRRGRCLPCTVRKPPSPARTRQRDVPPRDLVWLCRPVLHFSFLPAFSRRMKTTHERGKKMEKMTWAMISLLPGPAPGGQWAAAGLVARWSWPVAGLQLHRIGGP